MPLCSKHPAFVEAPLFAKSFPIGGVAHLNQLSAPSQSCFPTSYQRPKLLPFQVGRPYSFADVKRALFRCYQTLVHKHKCHRGLVQLGVYLLAPRAT